MLAKLPHEPFLIDTERNRLVAVSWDEMLRRSSSDLHPTIQQFVDLVLVTRSSKAYELLGKYMS